jgi:hypothetical protein
MATPSHQGQWRSGAVHASLSTRPPVAVGIVLHTVIGGIAIELPVLSTACRSVRNILPRAEFHIKHAQARLLDTTIFIGNEKIPIAINSNSSRQIKFPLASASSPACY